jgi:hypothetical protein
MVSLRTTVMVLIAGLILLFHIDNAAAQACATMTSYGPTLGPGGSRGWSWTDTGNWVLQQDSLGALFGDMVTQLAPTCPSNEIYRATGHLSGNGQFSLTSTYTGTVAGCATTINMSGTVSGPGCANLSDSYG